MKADPSVQKKLLDLAELDTRALRLRHQRNALPVIAEIAKLEKERLGINDELRDARIVVDDLAAEQKQAEADVEQVRTRRKRDQDRMDAGQVTNPKDLARMQNEVASLERRIATLEDAELEVMEKLEQAQQVNDGLQIRVDDLDARIAELIADRDAAQGSIDAELRAVAKLREPAVVPFEADLLALYERLLASTGMGAAELRQRRCGGCQIELDHAELGRIRALPADVVVRCEECTRIMVRTNESGL